MPLIPNQMEDPADSGHPPPHGAYRQRACADCADGQFVISLPGGHHSRQCGVATGQSPAAAAIRSRSRVRYLDGAGVESVRQELVPRSPVRERQVPGGHPVHGHAPLDENDTASM